MAAISLSKPAIRVSTRDLGIVQAADSDSCGSASANCSGVGVESVEADGAFSLLPLEAAPPSGAEPENVESPSWRSWAAGLC